MTLPPFPRDFLFGAASAAYQIEGAAARDGRGPSVWDAFCARRGKIADGTSGAIATAHYDRMEADLDLIADLKLQAYRFSISWPRVMPEGTGAVNLQGLDFYDRLVDGLLARGVIPVPTLYHWDMPLALYRNKGGFFSRDVAEPMGDYARVVSARLGDRVTRWITLNEPWEHGFLGHCSGEHAPGNRRPWSFMQVMHHQLLGHGHMVQAIRAERPAAEVGLTVSINPIHPASDSKADQKAAERLNRFCNAVCLDPVLKGAHNADLMRRFRLFSPQIAEQDMALISTPVDFIGINNYSRHLAKARWWMPFMQAESPAEAPRDDGFEKDGTEYTAMGWEIYPHSLGEALKFLREGYDNPPVYVTENGIALGDVVSDGAVHDTKRIAFLEAMLGQLHQALDAGSDLRGYFVWSLTDNFEWALGLTKRFGLIHVDYETQSRTPKDSALWYRNVITAPRG